MGAKVRAVFERTVRFRPACWCDPAPRIVGCGDAKDPDRLVQIFTPKSGQSTSLTIQLGVADLPEQIVADAHLAGGADEQIRVGHAGGVEVRSEIVYSSMSSRIELAGFRPSRAMARTASVISARLP